MHIYKNGIISKPGITTNYIPEILPKNVRFEKSYAQSIHKVKIFQVGSRKSGRKVKEWRQQHASDMFFFRGYGEVVDEYNMGSINGMDSDIEVLLDELHFGSYYKVVLTSVRRK